MALVAGTVVVDQSTEAVSGDGLARSRFDAVLPTRPLPPLPTLGQTTPPGYSSDRPATQLDIDQMKVARLSILNATAAECNATAAADVAYFAANLQVELTTAMSAGIIPPGPLPPGVPLPLAPPLENLALKVS